MKTGHGAMTSQRVCQKFQLSSPGAQITHFENQCTMMEDETESETEILISNPQTLTPQNFGAKLGPEHSSQKNWDRKVGLLAYPTWYPCTRAQGRNTYTFALGKLQDLVLFFSLTERTLGSILQSLCVRVCATYSPLMSASCLDCIDMMTIPTVQTLRLVPCALTL